MHARPILSGDELYRQPATKRPAAQENVQSDAGSGPHLGFPHVPPCVDMLELECSHLGRKRDH